jgi:hypothetical protein
MSSTGKGSLQASDGRCLCAHACRHLALRQPRRLSRLEQGIEQSKLISFNAFYFCPHSGATKKLFDELIMCPHV